jgi:hypothetical protein
MDTHNETKTQRRGIVGEFGNSDFTQVKGISSKRRMPRLGKIRLGAKVKKGTKEYPIELPFFLVPDEVAAHYALGDKAKERAEELGVTRADVLRFVEANGFRLCEELPVMLPMDNLSAVFPQAYKMYGSSRGVKCIGNGEKAREMIYDKDGRPTGHKETECPVRKKNDSNPEEPRPEDCAKGKCGLHSTLNVMIPDVNTGGIYQINLGSYNSTVDVNSGIDYAKSLIGRAAMVPFKLIRVPTITHGSGQKELHFTLQMRLAIPQELLEDTRRNNKRILGHSETLMLPEPEDLNPEMDEPDVIEVEVEDIDPAEMAQEPQDEASGPIDKEEETIDAPESDKAAPEDIPGVQKGADNLKGGAGKVKKADLNIINALLNSLKVDKAEHGRCSYVAQALEIDVESIMSLSDLSQEEGQKLLGILKQKSSK